MRKRDVALRVVLACVAAVLAWMVVNAPSLYASAPRGKHKNVGNGDQVVFEGDAPVDETF